MTSEEARVEAVRRWLEMADDALESARRFGTCAALSPGPTGRGVDNDENCNNPS